MIYISYQGRFGNNLFQYFIAKILSDKYNQSIYNPLNNTIIETKQHGNKTKFLNSIRITDDNFIDIEDEKLFNSNIHLEGFFQNRKTIKLLEQNSHIFNNNINYIDGLFVHVRLGDIKQEEKKRPSYEYYADTISSNKKDINYISTDSPNDQMVQKLTEKFDLIPYNNSPEETIKFASRFTNKILSLGTFSWWIGFLGCNHKIFCPDQSEYKIWHGDIFPIREWITVVK